MPLIEWNQGLSVDVKQCDEQHEMLLRMINDLHDALKVGNGKNRLAIFRVTIAGVKKHFSDEEKLMKAHGYPGLLEQKETHELFVNEVYNLFNQFKTGGILEVSIVHFLKRLERHIQGDDKKYGPFLNSKGVY